jgi:hypothetical protein
MCMSEESNTFHLTTFESILVFSGMLFFVNVAYIAAGGDFTVLYIAKAVYLAGIVILLTEL